MRMAGGAIVADYTEIASGKCADGPELRAALAMPSGIARLTIGRPKAAGPLTLGRAFRSPCLAL